MERTAGHQINPQEREEEGLLAVSQLQTFALARKKRKKKLIKTHMVAYHNLKQSMGALHADNWICLFPKTSPLAENLQK